MQNPTQLQHLDVYLSADEDRSKIPNEMPLQDSVLNKFKT